MAYWQQLEGEVDDELTKDVASLRAILSESVPPSYPVAEREREESSSRSAVSELQICLDKNIALQELLTEKLTVLELALAENEHKLFEVERLGKMRRSVQKGIVTIWRKRKNDYFKDSRGQAPPSLSVVHKSLDQLGTAVYCAGLSWMCKKKEKSDVKLTEAVRRQIIDTLSQPLQASLMRATDRDEKMLLRQHIQDISKQTISQLVKEDVAINWLLLAYEEFNNSHTAADCELRWIGHTHPCINKGAWKKQEDKELMKIARSHNFFDWSSIASELGTGRTGFMCLQRYQQSLNPNTFTKVFSDEDDARLKEAIKIYGESRWSLVSAYVEGKTPPQCMQRWVNSLSPGIKKGRWTQKEDEVLREAVRKCGVGNWTNVATFVPGRTKSQVRERWVNHLDEKVSKTQWTKEEDRKLMEICQRHSSGPIPWATVAKEMVTRTDAMCLQRWLTIGDTSAIFSRFSKSCKQRETVMTSSLGKKRSKHTFREDDIEEMVDEATKEKLKMYGEKLTKRKRPRPRQIQQEDTSSVESGGVATGPQYAFPQGRFIVLPSSQPLATPTATPLTQPILTPSLPQPVLTPPLPQPVLTPLPQETTSTPSHPKTPLTHSLPQFILTPSIPRPILAPPLPPLAPHHIRLPLTTTTTTFHVPSSQSLQGVYALSPSSSHSATQSPSHAPSYMVRCRAPSHSGTDSPEFRNVSVSLLPPGCLPMTPNLHPLSGAQISLGTNSAPHPTPPQGSGGNHGNISGCIGAAMSMLLHDTASSEDESQPSTSTNPPTMRGGFN